MKNLIQKILFAGVFLFAAVSCFAAENKAEWSENYLQARKAAAAKKIPMLILFSGSDWCPPCMRLDKNILDTKEFASYAGKGKFVLFKADFPRTKKKPAAIAQQNQQLMQIYRVQGVPTIILAGADGKEFARTGFIPVDVKKYIEHLETLLKKAPKK